LNHDIHFGRYLFSFPSLNYAVMPIEANGLEKG